MQFSIPGKMKEHSVYRNINKISHGIGTAVVIQTMVFGNTVGKSASGVVFTRNPSTGKKSLFGEYMANAQGEDVVSGTRTPLSIPSDGGNRSLEELMPSIYEKLKEVSMVLEGFYKDMQDIEFTVQEGNLWLLQTRSGKRSPGASVKISVDMVREGLMSKEEAILSIDANSVTCMLHPTVDQSCKKKVMAHGLPASPGAVSGVVVFTPEDAEEMFKFQKKVILVCKETSPERYIRYDGIRGNFDYVWWHDITRSHSC